MTNEQLAGFIQQGGNDELLPILWDKVRHLIYKKCGKYWQFYSKELTLHGYSFDDFYQEGYNALLLAVKAFKSERGYRFTTYLNYSLKHVIRRLLSGSGDVLNCAGTCSLEQPLGDGTDGESLLVEEIVPDESAAAGFEEIERLEEYNALYQAVEQLPNVKREIIVERYFLNMTFGEIGKRHNFSAAYARQLHSDAIDLLRYGKEGEPLRKIYYENGEALPKPLKRVDKPRVIRHKGLAAFRRSGTSEIEDYVVWLLSHSK